MGQKNDQDRLISLLRELAPHRAEDKQFVEAGGAVSHEPKLGQLVDVELKIPWNIGKSRENPWKI